MVWSHFHSYARGYEMERPGHEPYSLRSKSVTLPIRPRAHAKEKLYYTPQAT